MDQTALILPDGSTSARITDLMKGTSEQARELIPVATQSAEIKVVSVEAMQGVEAAAILEQAEAIAYRPKVDTNAVQTMRVRHHAIARLLAMGTKPAEIGRIMDCSATTISNLEKSPAFQALLVEYMNMLDGQSIETVTRMRLLGNLGIDELTERLAQPAKAAQIKTPDLVEIVKLTADRTGLGPSSNKVVQLNGALSPADIRAFKAMAPPSAPRIIEISPETSETSGLRIDSDGEEVPQRDDLSAEDGVSLRAPDREVDETRDLIDNLILGMAGVGR